MSVRLIEPSPCEASAQLAKAAVDGIVDVRDAGSAVVNGLAKGLIEYALPRAGQPACGLIAGGLALIALSR